MQNAIRNAVDAAGPANLDYYKAAKSENCFQSISHSSPKVSGREIIRGAYLFQSK